MTGSTTAHYGLPPTYTSRWPVTYYDDATAAVRMQTWQKAVYDAAADAVSVLGASRVIDIGCGSGEKTVRASPGAYTGLDFGPNLAAARARSPEGDWREFDFDSVEALPLDVATLRGGVIVCADVIEHLQYPDRLLRSIACALDEAALAIISTPDRALTVGPDHLGPPSNEAHAREWTGLELLQLLRSTGFTHGVITWTPAHDLAVRATSITAFLSNNPERLTALGLAGPSVAGFVVAPRRPPKAVARAAGLAADMRRQGRRAQLRFLGRRRGI